VFLETDGQATLDNAMHRMLRDLVEPRVVRR
jgi:hypothetical protein